jgi:hypothetical protein
VLLSIALSVFIPGSLTAWINMMGSSSLAPTSETDVYQEDTATEMLADNLRLSDTGLQPVVILKEKNGELRLPI